MKALAIKIKNQFRGGAGFAFGNSILSLISGPVTLLLIPLFLGEAAQGFWFTFGSLAALMTFADLGLTGVVQQFSAHEYAHLNLNKQHKIFEGNKEHLERLISLFRFVVRWTFIVTLAVFPIITVVGGFMLRTHEGEVSWLIPWIIFMSARALAFIISEAFAFFQGTGQMGKTQQISLIANAAMLTVKITLLILRFDLYTLAIATSVAALVNALLLIIFFRKALWQLCRTKLEKSYKWFKSFFTLMWRFAISWPAGYLLFQIYTPLAFMMFAPEQAGLVGITVALIMASLTISMVWINVTNPKINMAVSKGEWQTMGHLVKKSSIMSICTFIFGAAIILGGLAIFSGTLSILDRFMGLVPMSILLCAFLLQLAINAIATYGRAYKLEPFAFVSLGAGILSASLTVLFVHFLSIDFIFLGLLTTNAIALIVFIIMFKTQRHKWRQSYIDRFLLKTEVENMTFTKTKLDGVVVVEPRAFGDNRGWFMETYQKEKFDKAGLEYDFIQDNHSYSKEKGTLRGLHVQNAPYAQAKLVRCVRGSILDVAVDLRPESSTYKQWVGEVLSCENKKMLMIPRGFAHGFVTLTDDVEVCYKVDNGYNKDSEVGIIYNDPELNVDWGVEEPVLSDKDKIAPQLKDCTIVWDTPETAETVEE